MTMMPTPEIDDLLKDLVKESAGGLGSGIRRRPTDLLMEPNAQLEHERQARHDRMEQIKEGISRLEEDPIKLGGEGSKRGEGVHSEKGSTSSSESPPPSAASTASHDGAFREAQTVVELLRERFQKRDAPAQLLETARLYLRGADKAIGFEHWRSLERGAAEAKVSLEFVADAPQPGTPFFTCWAIGAILRGAFSEEQKVRGIRRALGIVPELVGDPGQNSETRTTSGDPKSRPVYLRFPGFLRFDDAAERELAELTLLRTEEQRLDSLLGAVEDIAHDAYDALVRPAALEFETVRSALRLLGVPHPQAENQAAAAVLARGGAEVYAEDDLISYGERVLEEFLDDLDTGVFDHLAVGDMIAWLRGEGTKNALTDRSRERFLTAVGGLLERSREVQ